MFRISSNYKNSHFFIRNGLSVPERRYLHCDGRVINVCEYFESHEAAQAVLDKFYPKPKHVWKHGDVFTFDTGGDRGTMIYLKYTGKATSVWYIHDDDISTHSSVEYYLATAKFLFNIKEKI